jgi:hypothetical protein
MNLLFWIVGRICEDARIKAMLNAITAHDNYAMFICLKEFIVQNDIDLFMKQFPSAICKECTSRALPTSVLGGEMFKLIW